MYWTCDVLGNRACFVRQFVVCASRRVCVLFFWVFFFFTCFLYNLIQQMYGAVACAQYCKWAIYYNLSWWYVHAHCLSDPRWVPLEWLMRSQKCVCKSKLSLKPPQFGRNLRKQQRHRGPGHARVIPSLSPSLFGKSAASARSRDLRVHPIHKSLFVPSAAHVCVLAYTCT